MTAFDTFHFLRPLWLLAVIPWMAWLWNSRTRSGGDPRWSQVVDPALLNALVVRESDGGTTALDRFARLASRVAVLVAIIALAGPSWRYQPAPVFQTSTARVLVLDLTQSMNAQDLAPSRLARARFAAVDLIESASDGRLGVVAFAGTAHSVVPLTNDHRTVQHLIGTLTPDLMPVPGSAIATGLRQAQALLQQGQAFTGDVILLTDSAPDPDARSAARDLAQAGYRLSIVGFGTEDGAPIPSDRGGWVHDRGGRMTLARLDEAGLRTLAQSGGGRYQRLPNDVLSLEQLGLAGAVRGPVNRQDGEDARRWEDAGPWLTLVLLPLVLLNFRRGAPWLACMVVAVLLTTPAHAIGPDWLWFNADQRGQSKLDGGDPKAAIETFDNPSWRGVAAYEAGEYEAAVSAFSEPQTADDAYNLGNSLARAGDLKAASKAYAEALQRNPDHQDAAFNKELVERLQEQQSSDSSESQDGEPSDSSNPSESDQDSQPSEDASPSDDGSSSDRSDGSQGDPSQSNNPSKPGESDSQDPRENRDESPENDGGDDSESGEDAEAQAGDTGDPASDDPAGVSRSQAR